MAFPDQNRDAQIAKLEQAHDFFANAYQNWDTATAAQKDNANKQAMRALANLCRFVLGSFGDPGV